MRPAVPGRRGDASAPARDDVGAHGVASSRSQTPRRQRPPPRARARLWASALGATVPGLHVAVPEAARRGPRGARPRPRSQEVAGTLRCARREGGACRVAGAEGHRPADASAPNAGREAGGRGLARPRSRAGSLSLASVKRSGTCPRGGAVLFHGGRSHLPETHSASRSLPPSALSSGRAALPGCSVLGAALRGPRGRGRGHSVCPRCPHAAQAQRGRLVGPCRDWSRFPCGLSAPQTPASLSRGPLTLRAGLALAERVLRRVLGTCVAGTCREAGALAPRWWHP